MNQTPDRQAERGFTLVEAMIVATLLSLILAAIINTTTVATRSSEENVASAESITQCRRYLEHVAKLVLPAKMSTLKMPATQADVAALLATSVGEWIDAPGDAQWRNGIQFLAATGQACMNAALSTSTRSLELSMDAGETDNDLDDDGDGLIDEGTVRLLHEGVIVHVLHGVEICSFQLTDRLLAIHMRCGLVKNGRIHRADLTQRIFLRNN